MSADLTQVSVPQVGVVSRTSCCPSEASNRGYYRPVMGSRRLVVMEKNDFEKVKLCHEECYTSSTCMMKPMCSTSSVCDGENNFLQ